MSTQSIVGQLFYHVTYYEMYLTQFYFKIYTYTINITLVSNMLIKLPEVKNKVFLIYYSIHYVLKILVQSLPLYQIRGKRSDICCQIITVHKQYKNTFKHTKYCIPNDKKFYSSDLQFLSSTNTCRIIHGNIQGNYIV